MADRSYILSIPLLLLLVQALRLTSTETVPLAAVTGYRLPGIFALNDGKPFYLDRDPVTGAVSFNAGESGTQPIPSEPMAAESSPVADAATAADEYEDEEEDEGEQRPAPAAAGERGRPAGPLKAAPVVEEVEEDEPPPSRPLPVAPPLPKDQIDRKDSVSSSKASSGGRPNEIQDGGDNPYFHQFLNLNVHEYGDRIPGASSIRDEPYSFSGLNLGSSPIEREYKFPLISSSYANTKVQGVGGNYYYGPKGNDREKGKDKEKYRPAYADNYAPSSTKRPSPSYYHESDQGDEDHYYGRPSSSTSTSSASNPEEEEEEDYHKYAGSSHHQGNRGDSEEGADEEGEEEGDESIDDLVEEVSDYKRPPVPPKRPEAPVRQPPKESSPTTHHHHYQGDEAEEDGSQDYDDERPLYYGGGGGGYGGRPAADKVRPQQTYYYGQPGEDEEEEEEPSDVPQKKPQKTQAADQGEEDRPRPSQATDEAEEEEGSEEGESNVKEKPQKIPPKPSLTYLGFSPDFDRDHHDVFGEKVQGSQKIEKPAKESPGYKYGYNGPPPEFSLDGFYGSDLEGPQKKPLREPGTAQSPPEDEKPQPSNKNEEGAEEEEEEEEAEVVQKPYDNRQSYNPSQVVRFSPAQSSQNPTERPPAQQSQITSKPPTNPKQGTYYKPTYPSPYGIEEPFRPIYGPGEDDEETQLQPGQNYQQANKNQEGQPLVKPSSNPPYRPAPSPDTRPSGFQQYDSYYPVRPQNTNILPPKKKDNLPETTQKDPITSTYKPYYDSKTKKPVDQGASSWKVYPSNNANGSQPSRPNQDDSKDSTILREHVRPTTSSQEIITKRPSTLPPPAPPHREVIGIGSVGEPEYIKPANNKPSYGPFRFPEQDYPPQRPVLQPQNGLTFAQRPSINNPVTVKPSLPPPPFGLSPQGPQRPILPPSQNIRPQLLDNHPPSYHPQRVPALTAGPPLSPPPRRWEDRPVHPHPSSRPPQNFLHRPPPPRLQDQPLSAPPPTGGHPYKFVSRKPGQEPVLMGSAPNAVFGNGFNPNNKKNSPPNGPKAQAPDPNLPNILPQFRPNAKISYSTIQRENRPYGLPPPPPPPPQFGPNQRVSNIPERRIVSPFYDHLQPPPPPPNRLQRIQGPEHEIPYGPPQVYPFGPGGSPPVGRRSGQHNHARVGEDSLDSSSESQEESRKRPQVTTLQMMRNGLMEHQSARHPIVSKEDTGPKSTANPTATIQLKPTVYVTPDEGAKSASLSVDSSASEDHPVFVVYPVSDSSSRDDGVVVGTRGSQRPLPPSSIATETEPSVLPQRPNSVLSDFPYPLLKPSSTLPIRANKVDSVVAGPVYSLAAGEGPDDRSKDNTESNIIPYLQDYSPYATRKPTVTQNGQSSTSAVTEPSVITTSPLPTITPSTEKYTTKAPVAIVNAWQPDSEVEVSATMHTGNSRVPVNHRPIIEDKTEKSSPSPLNFQAPFHASENIDPSPDSGWSAVGGSSSTDLPAGVASSISRLDYNTGTDIKDSNVDSSDTSKFDFDNFKPQLFGGFKPIYSLPGEDEDEFKFALGTTERQER
ncbi:trithorax group protein osa-like [Hetaerina americana]|uniref:trithorax group protein osa-like n=1 Tax=Hetaerina americana TaxID=62018 RepID=UPI003A7F4ECC